jgi:hypothetical protein
MKNWPLRTTLLVFLLTSVLLTAAAVASTALMANRQLEQASVNSARQYTGDELAALLILT